MSSSRTDTMVEVTMPQMGVSVAEGTVVSWHKRPGDWVEADETVCEISSDKIDTEIPAPASGRLVKVLVKENETVEVFSGTEPPRERVIRSRTFAENVGALSEYLARVKRR